MSNLNSAVRCVLVEGAASQTNGLFRKKHTVETIWALVLN